MLTEQPIERFPATAVAERRKYSRYTLRAGTYAGCSPHVGEIVDISLGGLAFNYVEFGSEKHSDSNFILCGDDGGCLENLSYTVVSDKVCPETSALSHIVTRLRRIKFSGLTVAQREMIENFIAVNRQLD